MLQIEVISKNSKTIYNFLNFFKNLIQKNTKIIVLNQKIQKQKKLVNTLLKSPHIHKIAQEKFEYRLYKKKFLLILTNPVLFLIFLKKFLSVGFFDVKILINYFLLSKFFKQIIIFFNINNFYFLYSSFFYSNLFLLTTFFYTRRGKIYNFLNLLNIKGNILLQN